MALGNEELLVRIRGIDSLSGPAQKAEQSLRDLGNQAKRSQIQMNQFGGALTGNGKDLRKFAMGGLQQAGYQIGDFAVQVANGTSKMQAFGQQAPQLLQIFGPFGAIAGAAVSIFAAFAVAAEKAGSATAKTSDYMKDLNEQTKKAKDEVALLASGLESLAEVQARNAVADIQRKIIQQETKILELRGEELNENVALRKAQMGRLKTAQDQLTGMNTELALLQDQLNEHEKANESLKRAKAARDESLKIAEKMNTLQSAHTLIIGRQEGAQKRVLEGFREYYQSRNAAENMLTREEAKQLRIRHGEQIILMGQTLALSKTYAQRQIQGYSQYYASRIAGENLIRNAQAETFRQAMIQRNRQQWIDEPSVDVAEARIQELKDKWANFKANLEKAPKVEKVAKEIKMQIAPEVEAMERLANSMGQSFEDAFMSMIDGTKSAQNAFKDMTRSIIADLYRQFVVKQITGFISSAVSSAFIPNVGAPSMGKVSYEGGGYTGSGSRSGGVDGKGGFNAILHPNETVIDHTKGQGGQIVVNQTINVSTGVQQTVRTEIKSLMPQIAESAKAAVADAKRRGGSYGRAFA